MSDFRERTPEERERARREREARRAARAKGERPPKPSPDGAVRRLPKLRRDRPTAPAPDRAAPPPGRDPGSSAPAPDRAALPPDRAAPPPRRDSGPAPAPRPRSPGRSVDLERIRRIARQRRERLTAGDSPAESASPAPPRRRRSARPVLLAAAAVIAAALLWALASVYQPFEGEGEGSVRVSIPTGAGVGDIADLLDERGVVSSASFFEARVTLAGRRGDLKPGTYTLKRDMPYAAVIDALAGGPPAETVTVTIPEGRSRREIARTVRQAGLEGDYLKATRRSRELSPRRYGAKDADSLEGFLFPATYELHRGASVRDLVEKQLETFEREFGEVGLGFARRSNLTAYDVLIIASMVEREAMVEEERRIIASVIYNRMRRGIPLGIDATIRFATGNWSEPLKQSELELDTPYNTRENAGLPPGPIGSPGLESIRAAAKPAETDLLYYVVKPGTCGEHAFSETFEEFQRDARRYSAERVRRGGRSPTDCS